MGDSALGEAFRNRQKNGLRSGANPHRQNGYLDRRPSSQTRRSYFRIAFFFRV